MRVQEPRPRPHCSEDTLNLLAQCEAGIRMFEEAGDLRNLILIMAEKEELLKVAVQESIEWARRNTPRRSNYV